MELHHAHRGAHVDECRERQVDRGEYRTEERIRTVELAEVLPTVPRRGGPDRGDDVGPGRGRVDHYGGGGGSAVRLPVQREVVHRGGREARGGDREVRGQVDRCIGEPERLVDGPEHCDRLRVQGAEVRVERGGAVRLRRSVVRSGTGSREIHRREAEVALPLRYREVERRAEREVERSGPVAEVRAGVVPRADRRIVVQRFGDRRAAGRVTDVLPIDEPFIVHVRI